MEELVIKSKTDTKKIMIIFHGYGANKEDFLPVAEAFSQNIDYIQINIPDGIEKSGHPNGYQWFSLCGNTLDDDNMAFRKNEHTIKAYVDGILNENEMSTEDLILVGFSQGAMLSLILGLKLGVSHIISFCGALLDPQIKSRNPDTKIIMIHGRKDRVIPADLMLSSIEALQHSSSNVSVVVSESAAHYIDGRMMTAAIEFLAEDDDE
ncbi:MAG: dienelactone hydrolase family protein [Holosporaceae bacterium]|jgi:phospholipase/carboxylesterase|nr:dienelactone hydrolase family protein [Holosporaceae bacterium]